VSRKLVAYEGDAAANPSAVVRWGAAAVISDKELLNPATGHATPASELAELIDTHSLIALERPLVVREPKPVPFVVVDLDVTSSLYHYLRLDVAKTPGVVAHEVQGSRFIAAFDSPSTFDGYRARGATSLAEALAYEQIDESQIPLALSSGLTLMARDPMLNALRVHFAPEEHRSRTLLLCRALLADENAQRRLEECLEAMKPSGLGSRMRSLAAGKG